MYIGIILFEILIKSKKAFQSILSFFSCQIQVYLNEINNCSFGVSFLLFIAEMRMYEQ